MKKAVLLGMMIFLMSAFTANAYMLDYDFGSYSGRMHPYVHGFGGDGTFDEMAELASRQGWFPSFESSAYAYKVSPADRSYKMQVVYDFEAGREYFSKAGPGHEYAAEVGGRYAFASMTVEDSNEDLCQGYAFCPYD